MSGESRLYLKQMEVGPMGNFSYLVGDKITKEVAVIDPSWDAEFIQREAEKEGMSITAVFLTHGHYDHTNALDELLSAKDIPVYVSENETGFRGSASAKIKKIKHNEKINIGLVEFTCIHTPGHTPGGICFLAEGCLITGDTLFVNGCGRCDLAGSDANAMYDSLFNKIMKLPDSTVIYAGHDYGPSPWDTLGNQKKTNPYLTCKDLKEFVGERMGMS